MSWEPHFTAGASGYFQLHVFFAWEFAQAKFYSLCKVPRSTFHCPDRTLEGHTLSWLKYARHSCLSHCVALCCIAFFLISAITICKASMLIFRVCDYHRQSRSSSFSMLDCNSIELQQLNVNMSHTQLNSHSNT